MIYHIITPHYWAKFENEAQYVSETLHSETFIHCSRKDQIAGVLSRFYVGINDLLLMEIDETKLTSPLLYEVATDTNDTYPHIYGPINKEAIVGITPIH